MTPVQLRLAGAAAIGLLALAPALLSPFSITLMNYIGIYALAVLGLVLLTGIGGMLSFGQAAFVGIAAYATAWLTAKQGYSPWLGLMLGLALTGAVAALLGAVTLRLGGHFLSLSTIAWGLAIYFLFGNLPMLGQFNGISDVPPISIGGVALVSGVRIYYLIWLALIAGPGAGGEPARLTRGPGHPGTARRTGHGRKPGHRSVPHQARDVRHRRAPVGALGLALRPYEPLRQPGAVQRRRRHPLLLMAMVGGMNYLLGAVVGAAIVTVLKNSIQDYLPLIARGASGQLEIVVFAVLFILLLQRARGGILPFVLRYLPARAARRAGRCRLPSAVGRNRSAARRC
jgi:branched-chain amino acid transport system permease protein